MARKHEFPEGHTKVKAHSRAPHGSKPKGAPMPGKFSFNADEEQAMRAGNRASNAPQPAAPPMAPPQGAPGAEPDADEGLEGGM